MAAMLSSSAALAPGARLLNARARKSVGAPIAVPAARVVAAARVDDAETTIALELRGDRRVRRGSPARARTSSRRPRTRATPRPPPPMPPRTPPPPRPRPPRTPPRTPPPPRPPRRTRRRRRRRRLPTPPPRSRPSWKFDLLCLGNARGLRLQARGGVAAGALGAPPSPRRPCSAARRRRLAPAPARLAPASAPLERGVAGVLRRVLLRGGGVAAGHRGCFGCRRGARVGAPRRVCRPRRARRARLGRRAGARRRAGGDAAGARRAGRVSARVRRRRQRVRFGRGAGEGQEGVFVDTRDEAQRVSDGVPDLRGARARAARLCRWTSRAVRPEPNDVIRARARARTRREEGGGVDSERRAGVRDGARRRHVVRSRARCRRCPGAAQRSSRRGGSRRGAGAA